MRPTARDSYARISRRAFARLAVACALTLFIAACTRTAPPPTPAPPQPSPTSTAVSAPQPRATATDARVALTAQAVAPDGAIWYGVDRFDDIGGADPSQPPQGVYRMRDGRVMRFPLPGPVRTIAVDPDGAVYVGAGCGVVRFRDDAMETLAPVDCDATIFAEPVVPMDLAFSTDGGLWVAGVHGLAHYDGEGWTEFAAPARRLLVTPEGEVWAEGWDGVADSDCCFVRVTDGEWMTYTHTAELPVDPALAQAIRGLLPD